MCIIYNIKFLESHDHVLLLLGLFQMLMVTKKEGKGGAQVNGQMPLRNSEIFCQWPLMDMPISKGINEIRNLYEKKIAADGTVTYLNNVGTSKRNRELVLANLTEMLTKDFINEYNKPLLTLQSGCLAFSKKTHDDDFVTP